jgi:hypothetical protein
MENESEMVDCISATARSIISNDNINISEIKRMENLLGEELENLVFEKEVETFASMDLMEMYDVLVQEGYVNFY